MRRDLELAGRKCSIYTYGDGGPAVIWLTEGNGDGSFDAIAGYLSGQEERLGPFTLLAVYVDDWNDTLSPWPMDAGEDMRFGGGGPRFLDWLTDEVLPWIRSEVPGTSEFAVTGYSLAGLFSLWAFYSSGAFRGAGCCSGSLWFEGWNGYADSTRPPRDGAVYLSLGGKEAGSGNIVTASVGTRYLEQKKRLERSKDLRAYKYELNQGGHFSNPTKRVAKSIIWLIEELSVYRGGNVPLEKV